ncbi:MAG: hypothetical protein SFX73_19390 [Kofleriaceae bacterium]|nr:hypothetical protein [Kofleriaceae bacterium]
MAVTLACVASGFGCGLKLTTRASEADAQKEESAMLNAFVAEVKAATRAHDYKRAAAAFSKEREARIGKYGGWNIAIVDLWKALGRDAESLLGQNKIVDAAELYDLMASIPLDRVQWVATQVREARAPVRARAAIILRDWNAQTHAAEADEKAGRLASAAVRWAAVQRPPSETLGNEAAAKVCMLVDKIARANVQKVHVSTRSGDQTLLGNMLASLRKAPYGGSIELVDSPGAADVHIAFGVGPERIEKTVETVSRTGRYVASTEMRPNPEIPRLREKLESLDKDIASKQRDIERTRCDGECKSVNAKRDQLERLRERRASTEKELARAPQMKRVNVEADHTYAVNVHTWTLYVPLIADSTPRGSAATSNTRLLSNKLSSEERAAVPVLKLPPTSATAPSEDKLRNPLHADMVNNAAHVVYNNMTARNAKLVAAFEAARGADRAERYATWLVLNPWAAPEELQRGNGELAKGLTVNDGASRLAQATQACWRKGR